MRQGTRVPLARPARHRPQAGKAARRVERHDLKAAAGDLLVNERVPVDRVVEDLRYRTARRSKSPQAQRNAELYRRLAEHPPRSSTTPTCAPWPAKSAPR